MNAVYILSGLGIFSLLAEIFSFRRILFPVILIGLAMVADGFGNYWITFGMDSAGQK